MANPANPLGGTANAARNRYVQSVAAILVTVTAFGTAGYPGQQTPAAVAVGPSGYTEEQLRGLRERVIANQHKDDQAGTEYEHVEHHILRGTNGDKVIEDKVFRVVPTGTGTLKLVVRDGGVDVSADFYQKELLDWKQQLEVASNPDDWRTRSSQAKTTKRLQDRAEMVDSARDALVITWLRREWYDGEECHVFQMEPNPNYQPHTTAQDILSHVRATAWVDAKSEQLVRVDAEVVRDISFGGGVLAKIYRGGHFSLEQMQVAPGLWVPRRYQLDYMGRKFLFSFENHVVTELSGYRRLGTTKEALAKVRAEVSKGEKFAGDP
jgi:hypothetical protein